MSINYAVAIGHLTGTIKSGHGGPPNTVGIRAVHKRPTFQARTMPVQPSLHTEGGKPGAAGQPNAVGVKEANNPNGNNAHDESMQTRRNARPTNATTPHADATTTLHTHKCIPYEQHSTNSTHNAFSQATTRLDPWKTTL